MRQGPIRDVMKLDTHRHEVEKSWEYLKWVEEIPDLDVPPGWTIRPIPPFGGAVVRFLVRRSDTSEGHRVSVYLDCYGELGATYEPYWEIYPGTEQGDTYRVYLNETDDLISSIRVGLNYLANHDDGGK